MRAMAFTVAILAAAVAGCAVGSASLTTGSLQGPAERQRGARVAGDGEQRVFTLAGLGPDCKPALPALSVVAQPKKGTVSFKPVELTTVQFSVSGNCVGQRVNGQGVFYTPAPGQSGYDAFTISAALGGGQTVTRTIDVQIAR